MKALILKDYYFLKMNMKLLLAVVGVSIFLLAGSQDPWEQAGFVLGYGTFVSAVFVVTTISYDDNGNSVGFLLTMPFSRNLYVREKYVFGLLAGSAGWLVSSVVVTGFMIVQKVPFVWKDLLMIIGVFYLILLFILALMLPVQLKFGGDKARIALLVVVLCVAGIGMLLEKFGGSFGIDWNRMLDGFLQLGRAAIAGILAAAAVAVFLISAWFSCRIVAKKQF